MKEMMIRPRREEEEEEECTQVVPLNSGREEEKKKRKSLWRLIFIGSAQLLPLDKLALLLLSLAL